MAREVVIEVHKTTLTLPRYEMYETGSQIRRSSKSVKSNIVEGYGRRYYKNDFVKYVIYALASNMETIDHLETLFETGSMRDEKLYVNLSAKLELLGKNSTLSSNTYSRIIKAQSNVPPFASTTHFLSAL